MGFKKSLVMILTSITLIFIYFDVGLAIPPVYRTVLSNHLTVIVCEEHSLPIVSVQLMFDAGSVKDPDGLEGLSYITARSMLLGTKRRTALDISKEIDFIGASINILPGNETTILSMKVLKKDIRKGINMFLDILTEPSFPSNEIEREIEKTLGLIESINENPGEIAAREFQKRLYEGTRYGHPIEGTKESIIKIKRDNVLDFYKRYYRMEKAILVIVGDITPQEAKEALLDPLEKIPNIQIKETEQTVRYNDKKYLFVIDRDVSQANIILGHAGITRNNPDYYAISVLNQIFGSGGLSSRLTEEVRNKRGLAYSVYGYFDARKHTGSFQIIMQTKNASAKDAIFISIEEMKNIREKMVSDNELESAKKYLIGSFPLRIDTQAKLGSFLLQVEYYGLGIDYPEKYPTLIKSITREEILRVAKKYIKPEHLLIVVVANKKEAGLDEDINSK